MEFFRIRRDIPFMRHALIFNVISLVTFLAAVFFLATRGLHFSIEFTGGTVIEAQYARGADVQARQTVGRWPRAGGCRLRQLARRVIRALRVHQAPSRVASARAVKRARVASSRRPTEQAARRHPGRSAVCWRRGWQARRFSVPEPVSSRAASSRPSRRELAETRQALAFVSLASWSTLASSCEWKFSCRDRRQPHT